MQTRTALTTRVQNRAVFRFALRSLIGMALAFVASSACAETTSASKEAFFEKEIRPLLIEHCYDCHSSEGDVQGGLRLDFRGGLLTGGDTGPAIVVGEPDKSLLIEAIEYKNRDLQMPPRNPLPSETVDLLRRWIIDGAVDPREDPGSANEASTTFGMSVAEGRDFWAFRPVSDHAVPTSKYSSRAQTAIDEFIFAKLEQNGLTPAEPADKVDLIRRVTQDMIGLPPTPDQIRSFLADDSPAAFDKVIQRLLNSPHYGVRWGRHWLDVARYADSNGLDENLGFGQAWRYRDYVVDAFNSDKPFDRFLTEQIAGDLLPDADQETKTATGFLALGAKVLAEQDRRKLEMDIIDEQLDTVGKTFMGMTLGCVRCHDHKFDPIKQEDYYALAAIFKSTKTLGDTNTGAIRHWYEHSFADDDEQSRLKEIEAQIAERKKAATSFKNARIAEIRTAARAAAADYLAAAARFDTTTSLTEVGQIAASKKLHPRILHHCRMHLEFHRDDPVFSRWHALAAKKDVEGIRRHYSELFVAVEQSLAEKRKTNAKATTLDDPSLESARAALHDASGFLAIPSKEAFAFDSETLAEYYALMDEARMFESRADDESAAMGVSDGEVVSNLPIHIRGSYKNLGDPVARDFPAVMRTSTVRPIFPTAESGRLELARWLTDTRHPLTARVIVNRVWTWHFGQGLVLTTENLGVLGDRPSHPELLDWLAVRFMESGWSIKKLHQMILRSAVYQMSSTHPDAETASQLDPQNRLLWKANIRRLEAEQIRDAILSVSGRIDLTLGGKTLPLRNRQFVFNHTSEDHTKYDSLRRAIYLPVIRNNLYSWFAQFDYPDPTMPTGRRNETIIAPQNLVLMNDELVLESAAQMADRLVDESMDDLKCVELAYGLAFGRPPTSDELRLTLAFLGEITDGRGGRANVDRKGAWALLCQSLIASNEFIYLR